MNVNELFDMMNNFGLYGVMQEMGLQGHELTQMKIIVLGAAAVI